MTLDKLKELLSKPAVQVKNAEIARQLLGADFAPRTKKRIRQNVGPNQTERRAMDFLQKRYPLYALRFHAITVEIANGTRYTPDIVAVHNEFFLGAIQLWEIKGPHAWEDSIIKLKVAARLWPQFIFHLMWEDGDGWQEQRILP